MAIVQDRDVNRLTKALSEADFKTTKIASTGGFLKSYNTTLIIGCEEKCVETALDVIKENCSPRRKKEPTSYPMRANTDLYNMSQIETGGATVFVLPVDSFMTF